MELAELAITRLELARNNYIFDLELREGRGRGSDRLENVVKLLIPTEKMTGITAGPSSTVVS